MKFKNHLILGVLLLSTACSKSEYTDEDDCLDPAFRAELSVSVDLDKSMSPYVDVDSTRIISTRGDPSWGLRYCVAAYRRNETTPLLVESSVVNPVKLMLPPDKYQLVAWVDHVPEDNGKSFYFHTDEFNEILLRHKYDYEGADLIKMAYRGKKEVRVGYTTTKAQISAASAMARLRIVATDKPDFIPGKVVVSYFDLPAAVNGLTGDVNLRWNDVSFISKVDGDLLAMDQVLAQDSEIITNVLIEIYDNENTLRARVKNIGIPIVRGGITTVKGNFYSILDLDGSGLSGGGISVDTEFDGTVEIEI